LVLPGGEIAPRPLHIILICDCSDSMAKNGKIQMMNNAIKEALPAMKMEADRNPIAQVYVRSIKFSSGAEWINSQPEKLDDFYWYDLAAGGDSDLGSALKMVADELLIPPMPKRMFSPIIILLSGSTPTDNFNRGMNTLMKTPWGERAERISIAVGCDADKDILQNFIGRDPAKFKVHSVKDPARPIVNAINRIMIDDWPVDMDDMDSIPESPTHHVFFICDCSDSMNAKGKITIVNKTIKEFIQLMWKQRSEKQFTALMSVISFSDGCRWVYNVPVPFEGSVWCNLVAKGNRDLGVAFHLLASRLVHATHLAPVLILITDGAPSDDYKSGLSAFWSEYGGAMSNRFALGIGKDAPLNILTEFTGDTSKVFHVSNEIQLAMAFGQISSQLLSLPFPEKTGVDLW
jgi:uncharacterized protein YegL